MLAFSAGGLRRCSMPSCACRTCLPLNPQGFAGVAAGPRLQHRRQLRHQHQLAVLWRRDDDEPFQPDGRAHGAELRLRRHRHRAWRLPLTRAFARSSAETVGNFWVDLTRATLYVLLPLSIVVALAFVAMGLPQTLDGSVDGDHARRRAADHRARPGRQPGGDQAARHQWRRLLQRQRRASVREPDRAVATISTSSPCSRSRRRWSTRSARWSATAGRAGRYPRRHRHPAGRRRRRHLLGRDLRQPDRSPRSASIRAHGQHGRQGGPLRPGHERRSMPR